MVRLALVIRYALLILSQITMFVLFTVVPKAVAKAQYNYFLEQESHPDTWFRVSYYDYVDTSRKMLASLINAIVDDIVLVENASAAVNSVLRSLGFKVAIFIYLGMYANT